MQKNLEYLIYSIKHPEKSVDFDYSVLKINQNIGKYLSTTKNIKEILITIKQLKKEKQGKKVVDDFYKKLQNELTKFSNCSEFVCFFKAFGSNLEYVSKDFELLKKITEYYLKYRTITELTSKEWIQAIIDNGTSRKKGHTGEDKVIQILIDSSFKLVNKFDDLKSEKMTVAKIKGKEFSQENIRKKLNIRLKDIRRGKIKDVIFKFKNNYYILEAKNINGQGTAQNSSIDELISIIELKEKDKRIHYISFIDGQTVNELLIDSMLRKNQSELRNIKKPKTRKEIQRREIVKNLRKNDKNYFLNTAGFNKFLKDILEN